MTITEITKAISDYNIVSTKKSKKTGKYTYLLIERVFARIMIKYYTYKWEHYFDY